MSLERKAVNIVRYYVDITYEREDSGMTIDKLGPVDPIQKLDQSHKAGKLTPKAEADAVSLSGEARFKGELHELSEQVKESPDIREDRVAEVKQKLQDPHYIDDVLIDAVADRVIDMLGLS